MACTGQQGSVVACAAARRHGGCRGVCGRWAARGHGGAHRGHEAVW